jgi:hypothetical protein
LADTLIYQSSELFLSSERIVGKQKIIQAQTSTCRIASLASDRNFYEVSELILTKKIFM